MSTSSKWDSPAKKRLIEQLADSPTALVCNALDFLGIEVPYMDESIRCLSPGLPPMVGEAVTIRLDSSTPGNKSDDEPYFQMLEYMSRTDIPKVLVIQTVGSDKRRECVAGDGLAKTLISVGAVGLATDGGMRDIKDMINQGFKVFGLGRVVHHTSYVWSGLCEPVQIGGVTVKTGDIVHGDVDGMTIVPEEGWDSVIDACTATLLFEKKAHLLLRQSELSVSEKKKELEVLVAEVLREIKKQ